MKTYEIHPETRPEQPTAVMEGTMTVSEIGSWLGKVYGEVAIVLARQGAFPAGPPFARYNRMGDGEFDIEAGFPVAQPISGADEVNASTLPGGTMAVAMHTGSYDEMEAAYEAVYSWIDSQGGEPVGGPWEVYLTDPQENPDPSGWKTEIVAPYRT